MCSDRSVGVRIDRLGHKVVSITVPGEIAYRGLVLRAVATICKIACADNTPTDTVCTEVVSAVGEAFNNAVLHAYADSRGEVCLTVSFDSSQIAVELSENGAAFDLDDVPELRCEEPQETGMGLFIIRSFVDSLSYTAGPPNRLRMIKRLPQH
jgi:serine/threonine-protein kinase RsbW